MRLDAMVPALFMAPELATAPLQEALVARLLLAHHLEKKD